jgi:hypothetical protein
MKDATVFPTKMAQLGNVETDSGGILLADGVWSSCLPTVTQERLHLDLGIEKCKIPVYGTTCGGKRYLVLSLDDLTGIPAIEGLVEVTDLPEQKEEEEKEVEPPDAE